MIIPLHGIRLDVDRIHIEIPLLRVQLRLQPLRRVRRPPGAGLPAVAVGGHERGEDAADDGAEEGEGGADDGDIAFCCGPVGGADVAVWILLMGGPSVLVHLGLDLQDVSGLLATVCKLERRRALVITTLVSLAIDSTSPEKKKILQSTNCKNPHQRNLLHARQLKLRKQRHWHDKQHQIRQDIHSRVKEPQRFKTKTVTLDRAVPELGNGHAVDEAADDRPGRVRRDYPHDNVAGNAEGSAGEDAEVLEEDGEFRACETGVVHGDGDPEHFELFH